MMGPYFHYFTLPFTIGVFVLFAVLLAKYVVWIVRLSPEDKRLAGKGFFSAATFRAIGHTFRESLLHVSIFKRNRLLGFMHMSLAFGWFLLIVFGAMESAHTLHGETVWPHVHIFFKYFFPNEPDRLAVVFAHIMDLLLLFILVGVGLAWYKRFNSKRLGMRRTTKHTPGDRAALTALWFIFPARLLAESVTCGLNGSGGFLTGTVGHGLAAVLPQTVLAYAELPLWWIYSLSLGVFFVALPFSRYMHIFTEIPHIFLKEYRVRPSKKAASVDNFQIQSCSRCGICIDACPLQSELGVDKQLPVYFLRDQRSGLNTFSRVDDCLMCGRCEDACPVGVDVNMLRLNRRIRNHNRPAGNRYAYLAPAVQAVPEGKVGYFSGCMGKLTPAVIASMRKIFGKAGVDAFHIDADNGVCCGRPLMLSGELDAARKMMDHNRDLILKNGIRTLVTSCPICLKVFKEDYGLDGVEILHHSQYIDRLIAEKRIAVTGDDTLYTYHDPCELGRGGEIYEEPRRVIRSAGRLAEAASCRGESLCCGSSLAHTSLLTAQKQRLADAALDVFAATGANVLVTSCPLCKTAFTSPRMPVRDIAEVVAVRLG